MGLGLLLDMMGRLFPCCMPERDSPIFKAVDDATAAGSLDLVRAELKRKPACISDSRKEDGAQPLHVAVVMQNADLVRLLLSHEAEVTAADKEGRTPLHLAALSGSVNLTAMILEAVPPERIDDETRKGCTALFLACWRGHLEIAQMLHAAGAKEYHLDKDGRSMKTRANEWNHKAVAAWLDTLGSREAF